MKDCPQNKRDQLRCAILPVAVKAFLHCGIKAVKMDDIAKSLKISKRTLYETYGNKKELFLDAMKSVVDERHRHMQEFASSCDNVMDVLIEFFRNQVEVYSMMTPQFFIDLQKYPDLFDAMRDMHGVNTLSGIAFCMRGVEEGYFRENVNYELLLQLSCDVSQMVREKADYSKFDMPDFFYSYVCTILRGVCTEKGLARIDEFINHLK